MLYNQSPRNPDYDPRGRKNARAGFQNLAGKKTSIELATLDDTSGQAADTTGGRAPGASASASNIAGFSRAMPAFSRSPTKGDQYADVE
jgi:hypothetical protein